MTAKKKKRVYENAKKYKITKGSVTIRCTTVQCALNFEFLFKTTRKNKNTKCEYIHRDTIRSRFRFLTVAFRA